MTLPATQFTHDFLQCCVSFSRNFCNGISKSRISVVTKIELATSARSVKKWMFKNCSNSMAVGYSTGPKSKHSTVHQYIIKNKPATPVIEPSIKKVFGGYIWEMEILLRVLDMKHISQTPTMT